MSESEQDGRDGLTGGIAGRDGSGWAWLPAAALLLTVGVLALPYWVPAGDPFRETLRLLPAVVLGFLLVDRLSSQGDGRRWGSGPPGIVPWALAALVVGLPVRDSFGFRAADGLWATGFLLVLAKAVLDRLPRLRRLLARRPPEGRAGSGRPAAAPAPVFFLLPWVVYLAVQPWALEHRQPDGDEPYYLLLAHSLIFDGDVDLADNYERGDAASFLDRQLTPQPGDPQGSDGEIYSRHTALLPLVLAPAYGAAGRAGAAALMAGLAALLTWWTLRLGLRLWPDHGSGLLLAWALLAFTPPLVLYAHQVWVEVPAALLTVAALDALWVLSRPAVGGPGERGLGTVDPSARHAAWVLGASLVLLPVLKLRLALVAVPLLLAALLLARRAGRRSPSTRVVLPLVALPLVAGLGLLAFNAWRYGNPARMYSQGEIAQYLTSLAHYARGGFGLLYDCAFGLFGAAPIWLLVLPAVAGLLVSRDRRLWLAAFLVLPYLLAVAPRIEWYGGWSPPFRYPLVFLPILALALVPLLERRPAGTRFLATAFGAVTVFLGGLWIVVPGWTYNLADGGSHLLHLASQLLEADVLRLFPSTVRYRPATPGWILASLLTVPIAWLGARRGRRLGEEGGTARLGRGMRSVMGNARARRWAAPAGILATLVSMAVLPLAAGWLPTRVVHPEDAWVAKRGGRLDPERWTLQRPAHRGAWLVTSGAVVEARIVPPRELLPADGPTPHRLSMTAHVRRLGPGPRVLELRAGPRTLARLEPEEGPWQAVRVESLAWPEDQPLVLTCPETSPHRDVGILVDRVELEWE